jgi:hypothetical protein
MANLIVVIELVGERPHPASLEVLGQARRIGTELGATVYAVAPCASRPGYGDDDLIAVLSRHGADKVLFASAAAHAGPMRWGTHGAAILVACATMQPLLLLLADTHGARDLTGRLAARLGAAYLADAWLEIEGSELALYQGGGGAPARRLGGELDFTVVAAIPPGRYATATGGEEAEVELLEVPGFPGPDFAEVDEPATGPCAAVLGEGAPAAALAEALHGAVGAAGAGTALAVSLGASFDGISAAMRVALGHHASACGSAHYAVEGDPDQLALELAGAVQKLP